MLLKITITSIILGIAVQIHAEKSPTNHRDMANFAIRPESETFQELQDFESSNLPIFVIDTDGAGIQMPSDGAVISTKINWASFGPVRSG